MTDGELSHVDASGKLRMVDVSDKEPSVRTARASCVVVTSIGVDNLRTSPSGLDPVQSARLTGIQAAKLTSDLIPLCHPLALSNIEVDVIAHPRGIEVRSAVTTNARTGVEMEAITACGFCAVSLLDALVDQDPDATMHDLQLLTKTGGKSDWGRDVGLPK